MENAVIVVTPLVIAGFVLAASAYAFAWLKGGHPERFGAALLIIDYLITKMVSDWRVGDVHIGIAVLALALLAAFGWLALRSVRWWPLVVTATLLLILVVQALPAVTARLSHNDIAAANNGLLALVHLALIAGVGERWLAGERAVSETAVWRRRAKSAS